MALVSHLGMKLLLHGHAGPTEKQLLKLPKEYLQGFYSMKESARHSVVHRRKQVMDFAITSQNSSSNFMRHEKVC